MIPILHSWSVNTNSYLHVTYQLSRSECIISKCSSGKTEKQMIVIKQHKCMVTVSKVYLLQYTAQMLIIFSVNEKGSFDSLWLHQFHTTFYIIEQFHYQRFFSIKEADSSMLMIQTRGRKVKVSQAAIIMLIIFYCTYCHHGSVWSCSCLEFLPFVHCITLCCAHYIASLRDLELLT